MTQVAQDEVQAAMARLARKEFIPCTHCKEESGECDCAECRKAQGLRNKPICAKCGGLGFTKLDGTQITEQEMHAIHPRKKTEKSALFPIPTEKR